MLQEVPWRWMVVILPVKHHFIFYGNASAKIGAGHIMRLFALAQCATLNGIKISFICKECPQLLIDKIKDQDFDLHHCQSPLDVEEFTSYKPTVIVIDDYALTSDEWCQLNRLSCYKVLLDDNQHQLPLHGDLIVNPAPDAVLVSYKKRAESAVFCLGPEYTLLRQEFISEVADATVSRDCIIITLGGADIKNLAYPLSLQLLKAVPDVDIDILLGGLNNSAMLSLLNIEKDYPRFNIHVNPESVAQLFSRSGLAIAAAGGTLGELASLGVPTIALITVDNQLPALSSSLQGSWYQAIDVREYYASEQCNNDNEYISEVCDLAASLWRNQQRRQEMSEQARLIVDKKGCQRIVSRILTEYIA